MQFLWFERLRRIVSLERFLRIAGSGLILVAALKGVSLYQEIYLFELKDPLLKFANNWQMTFASALTEAVVGLYLIWGRSAMRRLVVLGTLSHLFVLYRVGLLVVGYDQPCSCYGTLLEWMPERVEDWIPTFFGGFLLFMLAGTYVFGAWLFKQREVKSQGGT